jgi:hypothetical protein
LEYVSQNPVFCKEILFYLICLFVHFVKKLVFLTATKVQKGLISPNYFEKIMRFMPVDVSSGDDSKARIVEHYL